MSASLVGSEMCIRDRTSQCPDPPPVSKCGTGMIRLAGLVGLQPLPHPVSYTHLTLPTICSV
eukprot:2088412-Alexandrium_andersonii.AAC.1